MPDIGEKLSVGWSGAPLAASTEFSETIGPPLSAGAGDQVKHRSPLSLGGGGGGEADGEGEQEDDVCGWSHDGEVLSAWQPGEDWAGGGPVRFILSSSYLRNTRVGHGPQLNTLSWCKRTKIEKYQNLDTME